MDLRKIITYLNTDQESEADLQSFFEEEDVRAFLLKKWDEHQRTYLDLDATDSKSETDTICNEPSVDPEESVDETNLSTQTSNQSKPLDMPTIPIIPDDEETKDLNKEQYENSKDEALHQKLKGKFIQLTNGKVNHPYSFLFDITNLDLNEIGEFWFEGLENIGLSFNKTTDKIEGIPTLAGDHKIVLKCKRNDWQEGYPIFERLVTLIVNPDPRSLWNNKPTPEDVEYYRPDSDKKYVKVEMTKGFLGFGRKERKDMVAASQRGRSHAHEGSPRDDDFSIEYQSEGDWYIMVVADGAGSAKYSRAGAHIACTTVTSVCSSQLAKYREDVDDMIKEFNKESNDLKRKKLGDALYNIIGSAVFKAYKDIEKESQDKGATMRDYATTLLVTIAKRFKFGWFISSFWVGDGVIGIYNKETQYLKIMGESDGGEFAGQTRFLTMSEIMQPTEIYRRLRFEIVDDFTALVLMSDGITDPKFETDSKLANIEKWNELWADISSSVDLTDDNEQSADQLLKWLDFWSQGNHDDRTIVILY